MVACTPIMNIYCLILSTYNMVHVTLIFLSCRTEDDDEFSGCKSIENLVYVFITKAPRHHLTECGAPCPALEHHRSKSLHCRWSQRLNPSLEVWRTMRVFSPCTGDVNISMEGLLFLWCHHFQQNMKVIRDNECVWQILSSEQKLSMSSVEKIDQEYF